MEVLKTDAVLVYVIHTALILYILTHHVFITYNTYILFHIFLLIAQIVEKQKSRNITWSY